MQEALAFARVQPVAYVVDEVLRAAVETGAPTGNADGNNPTGKRGWQWVMVTAVVTVFVQGLSSSTAAAIELLGLQPSAHPATSAVLGAPDPRFNGHRRPTGRQR